MYNSENFLTNRRKSYLMRRVYFNFHKKNDQGLAVLATIVESIKFVSDRPLMDLRKEAQAYMESIEGFYPNGLVMVVEIFE